MGNHVHLLLRPNQGDLEVARTNEGILCFKCSECTWTYTDTCGVCEKIFKVSTRAVTIIAGYSPVELDAFARVEFYGAGPGEIRSAMNLSISSR
jgi:hypothetical protein